MSKKLNKPKQLEVCWDKPEPFALKVEQSQDGERIASDMARVIDLKQQSEKLQQKFA